MWPAGVELSSELRDLLTAQRDRSEDFPYDVLQVKRPLLSHIYVRQVLRRREVERREREPRDREPRDSRETDRVEKVVEETTVAETMSITEALDANEHLLITGDAGAGKSTVGHVFCKAVSDYWLHGGGATPLREPVVALRVPARVLVAQEAWSTALAMGVRQALGQLLLSPPEPALFAERVLGVRWLVFVDGLDEIADEATLRQVVRVLASRAHRGSDYRLVVTTRRLDEGLMRVLTDARFATMNLEPFAQEQLVAFAGSWFHAQDPIGGGEEQAREFVRQTADGRLRELVRNPLLATIAAVTLTRHPSRPLPANQVDLYQDFTATLLEERASGRNIVGELRRVHEGRPARRRLAEWIGERRVELVRHLGRTRWESETSLLGAAVAWVAERYDELPDDWVEDLLAILTDSGVVMHAGDDLRFLHHSFAEYLAAQHYAGALGADPAELGRWVDRIGRRYAADNLIMFTLVLWGRRPGNDLEPVVRRLLDGDLDRIELAGRLLAEGASMPEPLAARVVERIRSLVLLDDQQFGELLGSFDKAVAGELYELVDRPDMKVAARIEFAIALGRLATPAYGARKLEALGPLADAETLPRLVKGLTELVPDGAARAERLLRDRLVPARTPVFEAVLDGLLDIGATDAVADAVRKLVHEARREATTPTRFDWWQLADDCALIARAALRAGATEEAEWAARQAFAIPRAEPRDLAEAAGTLLVVSDVDAVVAAVAGRPAEHRLRVAVELTVDHPDRAAAITRSVWDDPAASLSEVVEAGIDLLSAAKVTTDELLARLEAEPGLTGEDLWDLLKALDDVGDVDRAVEVGWRVLAEPTSDEIDFSLAADYLAGHGGDPSRVRATAGGRPFPFRAETVRALCDSGRGAEAAALAGDLLDRRVEEVGEMLDLVPKLVNAGELTIAERLLTVGEGLVNRSDVGELVKLARALLALDRPTEAVAAAREAAEADLSRSFSNSDAIECWLDAGGVAAAADVVADVLAYPPHATMRGTAADVLAERGLRDHATTLWLDLLTNPGTDPVQRFEVAQRLVACGARQEALAALDTALRGPARTDLRALLGWVHLSDPTAAPSQLIGMLRDHADRSG